MAVGWTRCLLRATYTAGLQNRERAPWVNQNPGGIRKARGHRAPGLGGDARPVTVAQSAGSDMRPAGGHSLPGAAGDGAATGRWRPGPCRRLPVPQGAEQGDSWWPCSQEPEIRSNSGPVGHSGAADSGGMFTERTRADGARAHALSRG